MKKLKKQNAVGCIINSSKRNVEHDSRVRKEKIYRSFDHFTGISVRSKSFKISEASVFAQRRTPPISKLSTTVVILVVFSVSTYTARLADRFQTKYYRSRWNQRNRRAIPSSTSMFTSSTASLGKEKDLFQKIRRTLKAKLVKTMFIYLRASLT